MNNTIRFDIPTSDPGYDAANGRWIISLGTALDNVSGNVNIQGLGADKLIVKRSATAATNFRVFTNASTGMVTLSGMTISNGRSNDGGGIFNQAAGTLNISKVKVVDNIADLGAAGDGGGGIASVDGIVNITQSTISGNSAPNNGSGILNFNGTLTLTDSSVSGNMNGVGALANTTFSGKSAVMNIVRSTISENSSGGIINRSGFGGVSVLNVLNSTVSGNSIYGGIGNSGVDSRLNVTSCTVTGNAGPHGAGIHHIGPASAATIKSTIVALSIGGLQDVFGNFTTGGFNLIGQADSGTGFTALTDHTGTMASPLDPKLDPGGLKDNGGPTPTIALQAGSVAINGGAQDSEPRDQRGFIRNGAPDIGAVEFAGTIPVSLGNISTRGFVSTGDSVLIGGFIISGTVSKSVLLRAIGPSLSDPPINLTGTLQDPALSLFNSNTEMIDSNDNWAVGSNAQFIPVDLQPRHPTESALLTSLSPGAYTAIVRGADGGSGLGLIEIFDQDPTVSTKLSNISTRGLVLTGDGVMIGGFIVKGPDNDKVVVRAIGPSLANAPFNITNALQNPALRIFDANGNVFASNDDWQSDQANDIIATGLQPSNPAESAIVTTLTPGTYTAIVNGVSDTTGVGLVEVYGLN